ncbi:MAG TPA: hypothetical protein VG708_11105 [Mycobacteriales bacterium]|nr:hypothetical protein [Mycobacteriales bacterium]
MLGVSEDTIRLFLHVLGATVWVGGQITLAALVPVLRAAGVDVPKSVARQFARIAWPAFALLIGTGVWNIVATNDRYQHDADYRHTVTLKLVVVALSGLSAYLHQRATSRGQMAVFGAATGLFALGALFVGLMLSTSWG